MDEVECVVVGAGVVGLAVARALARAGREVLLLEGTGGIGNGVSSRNSEVIHAGIYYETGSLKARACVAGKHMLYDYCARHGIPHARLGKLIVAATEQDGERLARFRERARDNGVPDLELLDGALARALEPEVACAVAVLSPSTGIVDSHALMLALQGDAEDAGATVVTRAPVAGGAVLPGGGAELHIVGTEPTRLRCALFVNASGLHAPDLARTLGGVPPSSVPRAWLCKGSYYALSGRAPFRRLVYPMPEPGGLGVHLTLDLGGQARFGPDVEWVEREDYDVDPSRADTFYAAIRRYWPSLKDGALAPAYAGIRPKISGPDELGGDFVLSTPAEHGVPGVTHLYGIESPGLTASLAIADMVVQAFE